MSLTILTVPSGPGSTFTVAVPVTKHVRRSLDVGSTRIRRRAVRPPDEHILYSIDLNVDALYRDCRSNFVDINGQSEERTNALPKAVTNRYFSPTGMPYSLKLNSLLDRAGTMKFTS